MTAEWWQGGDVTEQPPPPDYVVRSGRPARPSNSLGAAAVLIGAVALFMSLLPVPAYFAWAPGIVAVVLGSIGTTRPRLSRVSSIVGIALGAVGLLIATLVTFA